MYDFGLSDEQFWALTPAQFSALSDRFDQTTRQHDFRTAHVISVMCNLHGRGPSDPHFTPQQFMPNYDGEETPRPAEMTAEDMLAHLKAAFPPRPEGHGG